jgi:tetratricopeptide (TPR) repeat protein
LSSISEEDRPYTAGRLSGASTALRERPGIAPALLATVALLVLATASGGYFASAWYAAALFLLALLAVTLVMLGVPRETPRLVLVALGLFACFTLFAYVSIAWASQAGAAWDGANRDCLYLIVLALFSLWPVGPGGLRAVLALVGAALALLGLVELLRMALASDPTGFFIGARLAEPAGYINANAALWTLGLLPCVGLASARELAPPLRALALAGATLLAGLALMSQSRGWLLTVPFGALALLALSPGRLRTLGSLVLLTAATAAVSGPLLAVHDHFRPGRLGSLVDDAAVALLLAALVAGLLALAFGFADRRVRLSPAATRGVGVGVAALVALVVAAGVVAVASADTGPVDRVSRAWHDFKHGGEPPKAGQARLSAVATNRYDFWRLGWKLGREHPLKGIGAENYQEEYLAHGRSSEQPRYTHSLELEAFSQLGIPGLLLLLGALGAAVAAALRARAGAALAVAACLGTFVYWLLHASLDWLWEIPAVTGLALALLAAAAGFASPPRATAGGLSRVAAAAGLLAILAVAVSFVLPWVAELDVRSASRNWPSDPAGAQQRLDRAEKLNPLSPQAQLTSATISLRLGRNQAAARSFRDALEREPRNIYATFELGLIDADSGRRGLARRTLQRALRLSPRDEFTLGVLGDLRAGRKIRITEVNQRLLARARLFNR